MRSGADVIVIFFLDGLCKRDNDVSHYSGHAEDTTGRPVYPSRVARES